MILNGLNFRYRPTFGFNGLGRENFQRLGLGGFNGLSPPFVFFFFPSNLNDQLQ